MWRASLALLVALIALPACSSPPQAPPSRTYPLTGVLLAVNADKTEVTVRHDEVKGFMSAMTMPFIIKDKKELDGLAPGDVIAATLVVTSEDAYLTALRKTGTSSSDPKDVVKNPPH